MQTKVGDQKKKSDPCAIRIAVSKKSSWVQFECIILPLTGFDFAGVVEAVQKLP